MNWEEIVGHADIIAGLRALVAGEKVPHALLFAGPAGIGKAAVARMLAGALLCSGSGEKPCGVCPDCRRWLTGSHPDLVTVSPAGATLKIDRIRDLKREAALAPVVTNGRRVFIIEDSERLTVQAANSFLKLLEEPPAGVVFILLAAGRQLLLPTIVSRCQVVDFPPLPAGVLTAALTARGFEPARAALAARLSSGRMGTALALLQPDGLEVRDRAAAVIGDLATGGLTAALTTAKLWGEMGRPVVTTVLNQLLYLFRDMLVVAHTPDGSLLYNPDLAAELTDWGRAWDEPRLTAAIQAVDESWRALNANANVRLTGEALLLKLCYLAGRDNHHANGGGGAF
mgnify:CR=1 FL=1